MTGSSSAKSGLSRRQSVLSSFAGAGASAAASSDMPEELRGTTKSEEPRRYTVPEALLLSTRERYAVTLALDLALVLPLIGLTLVGAQFGGHPRVLSIAMSATVIFLSSTSMPLLSDIAQRAVLRGPLARILLHLTLASTHVLTLFITSLAVLFTVVGQAVDLDQLGAGFVQNAQSGLLCYAATSGVIRAIQWYRSASLTDAERRTLEQAQLEKARDLVEQTLRPGMVGEALRRIRDMLPHRRTEAERAVRHLARHGRMLTAILAEGGATTAVARLRTLRSVLLLHEMDVELETELAASRGVPPSLRTFAAATEEAAQRLGLRGLQISARMWAGGQLAIGVSASGEKAARFLAELEVMADSNGWSTSRCGASAELELLLPDDTPAEPGPAQPMIPLLRNSGSVYTWVAVFVGISMCANLYATTLSSGRLTPWCDVAAALSWLVAALPLIRISERIVTLRRWLVVPALWSTAWLTGTTVSIAALAGASAYTNAMSIPIAVVPGSILPMVARQNVLIACAIAGVSFAFANSRQLLAAQASVGRMRQVLASAELRNLEARIQPHFLFNALVSLLALIRLDPARAAKMCDLLSDLFARSVAATGVHEWPLREEIALTTDYLAVQHIRFGERLVVRTAVDPELHDRLIPRLLLQPLVENAVKHGVARREEPTHLTIAATHQRGALHLEVVNDSQPVTAHSPAAGGGLTFVRSRVAAAGGTVDHDASRPGTFSVRCVLPFART
jgi:hypothetical protein